MPLYLRTANSYDGKGSHRIFIPYFQLLIQMNNITMPRLLVVCYSGYTISSSGITAITFNQVLDDANCILDRLKIIVARHQIYQQKELSPEFRSSTVDQILKLVQLKELKVITEEEFQVEKRKVLKNS